MSVVNLFESDKAEERMKSALSVIDSLRDAIVSGEVVGFVAVAIDKEDNCKSWTANPGQKSRLVYMGATSRLLHSMHSGDV